MQTFISELTARIGRQLNASEARRSAMVCWIVAPVFALLGMWALASHFLAPQQDVFRQEMMLPVAGYAFACITLWLGLGLWGLRLDQRQTHSPGYTAVTLWAYALTSVSACYLIGTLNVVTGLVMMGAPMLGLILFTIRQVLVVFVAGLLMMLTLSLLSALQMIPYAPILKPEQAASAHLSLYWTLCLMLAGGFYVIYQTIIMSAMVRAWHSREHDIRTLSQTDALTGVANRRHILELLDEVLDSNRGADNPVAVLMVDIDHFKRINDDHGHLVGDRALTAAAAALRDCLRQGDMIGRYGGEEFLIVLPGTRIAHALDIAERCRQAIGALAIDTNGSSLPLTASVGLACRSRSDIENSDHVIHLADEAMYEAKKNGRNRVVAA
ncbi:MAG: GGDEF domain-containing protein [Alcanivoracaceae bacterium]|jgi:diguanylate cyclase (GGDEF)-like protein|nr:GGDEF domain-containing protein [Alcanivoracaceae bacterium]